nr:unnamed protein product [Callosobruchus chinensis]
MDGCQQIGHVAERCEKEQLCVCGRPPHEGSPCEEPKKCVNCEGSHSAIYKGCPVYKEEAVIQKVKVMEKVSYAEAKRKVKAQTPKPNFSYAAATATSTATTSTVIPTSAFETDVLIPQFLKFIRDYFSKYPPMQNPFKVPDKLPEARRRSDSTSTNVSTRSEQRKRPRDEVASTSEDEISRNETSRKKGWPKGKPRK